MFNILFINFTYIYIYIVTKDNGGLVSILKLILTKI